MAAREWRYIVTVNPENERSYSGVERLVFSWRP